LTLRAEQSGVLPPAVARDFYVHENVPTGCVGPHPPLQWIPEFLPGARAVGVYI
jgi:hypothetical protein